MKILTLYQPYATLLARGLKRFETRSWYTPYRGLVLIHAAKKWTLELQAQCLEPEYERALKCAGYDPTEHRPLPLGRVLAVGELVACHPTAKIEHAIDPRERAFGDWSPGRFAWDFRAVSAFAPIPRVGTQGLKDAPEWLVHQVERTYAMTPAERMAA